MLAPPHTQTQFLRLERVPRAQRYFTAARHAPVPRSWILTNALRPVAERKLNANY